MDESVARTDKLGSVQASLVRSMAAYPGGIPARYLQQSRPGVLQNQQAVADVVMHGNENARVLVISDFEQPSSLENDSVGHMLYSIIEKGFKLSTADVAIVAYPADFNVSGILRSVEKLKNLKKAVIFAQSVNLVELLSERLGAANVLCLPALKDIKHDQVVKGKAWALMKQFSLN